MVGEHAYLRRMVHEPLVQGRYDGSERYVVATLGEDGLQTGYLLFAVGKEIYHISL